MLNIESKGYTCAVFNRTTRLVPRALPPRPSCAVVAAARRRAPGGTPTSGLPRSPHRWAAVRTGCVRNARCLVGFPSCLAAPRSFEDCRCGQAVRACLQQAGLTCSWTRSKVDDFVNGRGKGKNFIGTVLATLPRQRDRTIHY